MYPKPVDFSFTKDLFRFVGFLALIAACGLIYALIIMWSHGSGVHKMLVRSLDLVTIVVPPALPAAMTIGECMCVRQTGSISNCRLQA
jgi:cation-transporting ATPase 13A3/4/5